MKIVTFSLGNEVYGLEIEIIREIIMEPEITHVPNLPSFLKGIIRLRDQVIPMVEGVERLGYSPDKAPEKGSGKVFIVEYVGQLIGIRVGEARQVLTIDQDDINLAPGLISRSGADFVKGIVEYDQGENESNILLLDLDKFFTGEEIEKIKAVGE